MTISITLGSILHDGGLRRGGESWTFVSLNVWCCGLVGWGRGDKHTGEDQRLLGGAAAGLNLEVGIYLQGVLDSPGPGPDKGLRCQKI